MIRQNDPNPFDEEEVNPFSVTALKPLKFLFLGSVPFLAF